MTGPSLSRPSSSSAPAAAPAVPPVPAAAAPAAAVPAAADAAPRAGAPFKLALATAKQTREPEQLLSLAACDIPRGTLAQLSPWADYLEDQSKYSACHDIAQMLFDICGTGRERVAEGADGVAAAQEAVGGQFLIWLKSAKRVKDGHSVMLLAMGGHVESLEGWAGEGEDAVPLHACLFHEWRAIWLSAAEASAALGDVLSDVRATRRRAWVALSRAAGDGTAARPGIFGNEQPANALTVRIRSLRDPAICHHRFRERLDDTKRWVYYIRTELNRQVVCRGCLQLRGAPGDRWYVCNRCAQGYCALCHGERADHRCWLRPWAAMRACNGALTLLDDAPPSAAKKLRLADREEEEDDD